MRGYLRFFSTNIGRRCQNCLVYVRKLLWKLRIHWEIVTRRRSMAKDIVVSLKELEEGLHELTELTAEAVSAQKKWKQDKKAIDNLFECRLNRLKFKLKQKKEQIELLRSGNSDVVEENGSDGDEVAAALVRSRELRESLSDQLGPLLSSEAITS